MSKKNRYDDCSVSKKIEDVAYVRAFTTRTKK